MYKLSLLNIDKNILWWFGDYLSLRKQYVVLNKENSYFVSATSAVPQGSVLVSLMFFIYINPTCVGVKPKMILFTDDCVLYGHVGEEWDARQIQDDLSLIEQWCSDWKMCLSVKKCVRVSFTHKKEKN